MHYLFYTVDAHTPGGVGNDPGSVLSADDQGCASSPSVCLLARVVSPDGPADQGCSASCSHHGP